MKIVEGILTTESETNSMHVAPMGPAVDPLFCNLTLKPFQSSTTFLNLRRTNRAVFHVTDDALLLAQAVLGQANDSAAYLDSKYGHILNNSTHWYAVTVTNWDLTSERAVAYCEISGTGWHRPFFGWNRANHAVLEAAILSSRVAHLDIDEIRQEMQKLRVLVEKTGGATEYAAFEMLNRFIEEHIDEPRDSS